MLASADSSVVLATGEGEASSYAALTNATSIDCAGEEALSVEASFSDATALSTLDPAGVAGADDYSS